LESADDDWNLVNTTKVKVYHHRDKKAGPKLFARGDLKLQTHKESSSNRMVLRDVAGKVLLNVGITNDTTFQKNTPTSKPGRTRVARIVFYAVREESVGPEMLTLVVKEENLDSLHGNLEELSK
jgi:hypothetical protein